MPVVGFRRGPEGDGNIFFDSPRTLDFLTIHGALDSVPVANPPVESQFGGVLMMICMSASRKPACPLRRGITLLEVLIAIFITGLGLLALLTLFPLGALEMAEAIEDDRTGALVERVELLSAAGEVLLPATGTFLSESWANQSADPQEAAQLRLGYEKLSEIAADIDARLRGLAPVVTEPRPKRLLRQALIQIAAIQEASDTIAKLLRLLEQGGPNPDQ